MTQQVPPAGQTPGGAGAQPQGQSAGQQVPMQAAQPVNPVAPVQQTPAPVPQPAQPVPTAAQPATTQPAVPAAQQPIQAQPAPTGTLATGQGGQHHFVIPPHPNTQFNEEYFLTLLEGSISLTLEEKNKVIEAIPRLSIEQINELIKIFEEEKQKFSELEAEYADDVAKLKQQREAEFKMAEVKKEELSEADAEAAEAEALKKKLLGGQ